MTRPEIFIVVVLLCQVAEPARAQTARLAGTFNNWATGDDDYRMNKAGERYELLRFWPCGLQEFKIVFDGTWARHFGADCDGKLSQPGTNILLKIPQSGEYVIWVDAAAKKWGVEPRPPSKPHALILVRQRGPYEYQLDASRSLRKPGGRELACSWQVVPPDLAEIQADPPCAPVLRANRPGTCEIRLTVDDGEARDTATLRVDLASSTEVETPGTTRTAFLFNARDYSGLPKNLVIERVDLVGEFNGWRPNANPMRAQGEEGLFQASACLADGVYHYAFAVNGCYWLEDRFADRRLRESDGQGGFRSGVLVGLDASRLGPPQENHVAEQALKHDLRSTVYLSPISLDTAQVSLRTVAQDVERVTLECGHGTSVPMRRIDRRLGFDFWTVCFRPPREHDDIAYAFTIRDGTDAVMFSADGVTRSSGEVKRAFQPMMKSLIFTPDWAKRAVWYQIFPERFRNGDPDNDPPRTVPWTQAWYKPFKGAKAGQRSGGTFDEPDEFLSYIFDRRYGGDIQGVREKLGYLRGLGVNAIYFNPVFQAESLHKYDTSDYRHIDDFFGVKGSLSKITGETTDPKTWKWSDSDRVFLDFLKEAHAQGFKVILDGVFNHVGRDFWAFQDVLKHGERSPYAGWFDITSFKPFHYKAWDKDDGALPRLKHDDALGLAQPVREHLFAVTRRWMDPNGDGDPSDGIDGWRLDVAGDIHLDFWKDWRKLVKSINPDGYIVAELWEESKPWLDGQTFDALMNYPFARAAQRFFVNQKKAIKPSAFQKELTDALGWYAPQVNYVLQNLIDSHDTDRAASMCMNPDLEFDQANRQQDNGPNYVVKRPTKECYEKVKLMAAFQMTYLGAPMIYYGDEVGMFGADDPSCRKPMIWEDLLPYADPDERIEPGLFDHYRRMIAIRNTYPALQFGAFEPILAKDEHGVFAFARSINDEQVIVVLNNSDQTHRLDVQVTWPDGSTVIRIDDPAAGEIVEPQKPGDRATVRPVANHQSGLKVEQGLLHGRMMTARTAGIFVKP